MSEDSKAAIFNAKSGAEYEALSGIDKARVDILIDVYQSQLEERYEYQRKFYGTRLRQVEDKLFGQQNANLSAPRPDGVTPRVKQPEEIRQEAREIIQRQDEAAAKRIHDSFTRHADNIYGQTPERGRDARER